MAIDLLALALPLPFFVMAILAALGLPISNPIKEDKEREQK